jgi:SAM-dependent methyltransferase
MARSSLMLAPLHRFLRSPLLYIGWQRALGADRLRRICLDEFLRLREGERVLDVGCGPGYILNYMPRVDFVGFDTEASYIEYAKRRYRDRGRFFCEQFSQAHVAKFEPFNAIMLFGIIHHLDDVAVESLLGLLSKCLAPKGRVVTLDPCFVPRQSRSSRFVAEADRGRFVREEGAYRTLVAKEFTEVETRIVSNICRIPSTELIMRLGKPVGQIQ